MAKDSFKNSAHDLNNILTSIVNGIELLKNTAPKTEEIDKIIIGLENSSKRAQDIIHTYLSPTGTQRKHVEIINIHELLSELVDSFSEEDKSRITYVNENKNLQLLIDGTDLYRMLQNLIKNAIEAIDSEGKVVVNVKLIDTHNKKTIQVNVTDNGCGISNDNILKIFEPKFSTKHKTQESGYGLSIVKEKASEYNGIIKVNSDEKETVFTLEFPLFEDKKDSLKNLLLAEDDNSVSEVLADLLKSQGYNVSIASTGNEAISKMNNVLFDALIIDKKMPEMDGIEFIKYIRTENPEIPIILASGSNIDIFADDLKYLNIGLVIKKPYNFPEILSALQKFNL